MACQMPTICNDVYPGSPVRLLSAVVFSICATHGQIYTIHTAAGGGLPENTTCTAADLHETVVGLAADAAGNLYIPVYQDNIVVRCDASTGVLTRVAGTGAAGFSNGENVPATSVRMTSPVAVAVDPSGNLYIAEGGRVRKVANGIVTTVAGMGIKGFSGDGGPATSAQVDPLALTVDAFGNVYIADNSNRIRKVANGIITTVAGDGALQATGDNGPAASAGIGYPSGIAVDSAGNLFIADAKNGRVRKVAAGIITTVTM